MCAIVPVRLIIESNRQSVNRKRQGREGAIVQLKKLGPHRIKEKIIRYLYGLSLVFVSQSITQNTHLLCPLQGLASTNRINPSSTFVFFVHQFNSSVRWGTPANFNRKNREIEVKTERVRGKIVKSPLSL